MNAETKAVLTKRLIFSTLGLVTGLIAWVWVTPPWFCVVCIGVLIVLGIGAFSVSPAGSGHILDNAFTYAITATLLLTIAIPFGHHLAHGKPQSKDLWWSYMAEYDNRPGSIVVNLELRHQLPIVNFPCLVVTGVSYPTSNTNGLPDERELGLLNALAEKRLTTMREQTPLILAGSFTHNAERLDYVYVSNTNHIQTTLEEFYRHNCPDRKPYINVKQDSKWEAYSDFLFPNNQTIKFYREELIKIGYSDRLGGGRK